MNRALVVACERVFGKAERGKPSVLQLVFLVSYVLKPWKQWRVHLSRHVSAEQAATLTEPDMPLTKRWYTVIYACEFTDSTADGLILLGHEVYDFWSSSKRVLRDMFKQVHAWLHLNLLRLHVAVLVDFGNFFYKVEMSFAKIFLFQCALIRTAGFVKDVLDHLEFFF